MAHTGAQGKSKRKSEGQAGGDDQNDEKPYPTNVGPSGAKKHRAGGADGGGDQNDEKPYPTNVGPSGAKKHRTVQHPAVLFPSRDELGAFDDA